MYTNIEIKEEDPISTTQNESQFFTLSTYSSVDNDCDVTIKSETAFTDCSSLENVECFIGHPIKQIKCETITCSNSCEVDSKIDIDSEKNEECLPRDPVMNVKKYKDHEINNKIEIKEEPLWMSRETSSGCNDIMDGNSAAVKPPRLCTAVSTHTREDSSFVCVVALSRNARYKVRGSGRDYGSQENNAIKTPSVEKHLNLELSNECRSKDNGCNKDLMINTSKISPKCNICEKTFASLSNLKTHALIHEGIKPYKCEICEKRFTQLGNLKAHNLIHEGKNTHKCQICKKRFTGLESLQSHNLNHNCNRAYKCQICEKSFTRLGNLQSHYLIHEGKRAHKCQICEKRFTALGDLKRHALIHEGRKLHKCQICEKRFTELGSLKRHSLLIHEGKRPYECKICLKKFTRLGSLQSHNLIHEGKKPHKCQICMKRFTQLGTLRRHSLIHEGIKLHKCQICEKSFTELGNLKRHVLIHEGKKPHKCQICLKRFTRLASWKRHALIHEGKKSHLYQMS